MEAVYTLDIGAGDQSREDLKIIGMTRELRNLDEDVVTLTFDNLIDVTEVIARNTVVVVKKDGEVWFRGIAQPCVFSGDDRTEDQQILLMGVWWRLGRKVFPNIAPDAGDPTSVLPGSAQYATRRVLYVDNSGEPMTTQEVMNTVLGYAAFKGYLTIGTGVSLLGSTAPTREVVANRTIAEVIRSIMRYHVDVALWWDYTTNPPTLNFSQRGAEGDTVSYAIGAPPLRSVRGLRIRHDMAPTDGVFIRYEGSLSNGDDTGYVSRVGEEHYPVDADPDGEDILVMTEQVSEGEPIAVGLAQRYYEMLAVLPVVQGTLTFHGQDPDTGLRPGNTINITGGQAAWATCKAFVESVTEDVFTGSTIVRLGMPRHSAIRRFWDPVREQNYQRVPSPVGEETEEMELPASQGPLSGYCVRVGDNVEFRVAPGVIAAAEVDGSGDVTAVDHVPTWESSSTPLDAASPPGALVAEGNAFTYYLEVKFRPIPNLYELEDDEAEPFNEYHAQGIVEVEHARIVFLAGSPDTPSVDPESGDVTEGTMWFEMGTFNWPIGGAPEVFPFRVGSFNLVLKPPGVLLLVLS